MLLELLCRLMGVILCERVHEGIALLSLVERMSYETQAQRPISINTLLSYVNRFK